MSSAPWSLGENPPATVAPAGAVDCHHHIYDSRFPIDPQAVLRPDDATVADYRLLQTRIGLSRSVIVQPSTYGTDNRCLLDALAAFGNDARGIAVVNAQISDAELRSLDTAGVRGIRFNLARPSGTAVDDLEVLARRIAQFGWHVQLHTLAHIYPSLLPTLETLPVPIVIDHLGRFPASEGIAHPAWSGLRKLVDQGRTWVKLSGAYHDTRSGPPDYADTAAVARAWLDAAPERMVWGTDWPHPSALAAKKPLPDDAVLLDCLGSWAATPARLKQVLIDNPESLYGFSAI
jgi:D-galactarolactone isomerase